MRLIPLLDVRLGDFEVDAFDVSACALDLDPAEIIFEVREKTLRLVHQPLQSTIIGHVLRKIDQQHGHVEANVLGRMMKSVGEFRDVDFAILIGVHAQHYVINVLTAVRTRAMRPDGLRSAVLPAVDLLCFHRATKLLGRDETVLVGVELEESFGRGDVLHLEKDVEELQK